MENNTEVYVMFICDQWKSTDSHRFIGIATTFEIVQESVVKLLKSKTIGEENDEISTEDVLEMDFQEILNNITYFNATKVSLNEIETNGGYYL